MTNVAMNNVEPFNDCSDVLQDQDRLLSRATDNGYLYFPRLLPADEIMRLRHELLLIHKRHDLLKEGTDPDAAIHKEGVYVDVEYVKRPTPEVRTFYNEVLGLRSFNAFFHHPTVLSVLQVLLGEEILVHPRVICHIVFPQRFEHTVEPHQDFAPVRGTENIWTVWIPLGDCDTDLGGVAIARGSNQLGFLDADKLATGEALDDKTVWNWNPFTCGDVLIFHSLAVHQGRDNVTANTIRLATSARYQPVAEPVDALALGPQRRWAEWDELYAEWDPDDPLKYYWQSLPLDVRTY